jgi:tRNA (guanine-N7-)-methyltransferase
MGEDRPRRAAAARLLTPPERQLVYGRRRGRPLRPGQKKLVAELLPQLAFTRPASGVLDPRALLGEPARPTWLEIGFGGGEHLAFQAERHPEVGLIGCEVFENGIARLLAAVERRRLDNVRLFVDDARRLLAALPRAAIDRVFILFPDPWPKDRHKKRRLVSRATLDRLSEIMTDGAELRLATDDRDYLCSMLELVTGHPDFVWLARRPADWRERPEDWPATRYEEKARAAGRPPAFLRVGRRPRPLLTAADRRPERGARPPHACSPAPASPASTASPTRC